MTKAIIEIKIPPKILVISKVDMTKGVLSSLRAPKNWDMMIVAADAKPVIDEDMRKIKGNTAPEADIASLLINLPSTKVSPRR